MIITYGDFKDLNFPGDFETGLPKIYPESEKDLLRPFWKAFISGKLDLKKNPSRDEWENCVWINAHNYVFQENEYTSYSILPGHISRPPFWEGKHWIDRKVGVVVTEVLDTRIGYEPDFQEVKEREINWNTKRRNMSFPFLEKDFGEKACSFDVFTPSVKRWTEKEESRWFY